MNTYGGCDNDAKYIEEIKCDNFCSYGCYLLYTGKKKPPIPKRKKFADSKRQQMRDLYILALGGEAPDWAKAKECCPHPNEWVATFKNDATYLWDDFERKYVRYVLGLGIVDEFGKIIADENSDYYKAVIKRINDIQCNPELLHQQSISKPIKKPGVKTGSKRGPYKKSGKKKYTFVCKGCDRTFPMVSKRKKQFHSEACRIGYWRKKKKEKEIQEKMNRVY
jgi:hypothetical protein